MTYDVKLDNEKANNNALSDGYIENLYLSRNWSWQLMAVYTSTRGRMKISLPNLIINNI